MRRIRLSLLLIAGPAAALDNSIRIHDRAGAAQPGRPFTLSRFFARGEITPCAQPRVNAAPAANFQCDVKTRWDDGSVKHALISFQADLPASGTIVVDFVGNPNCNNSGALSQQQMLDYSVRGATGDWTAMMELAAAVRPGNTSQLTASARAMLAAGHWRYWLQGPVVTQVIVEGSRSSAATMFAYDMGWRPVNTAAVTLTAAVAAADLLLPVSANPGFIYPATIVVDREEVAVSGYVAPHLVVSARGVNGSKAVNHSSGRQVWNYRDNWVDSGSDTYRPLHPIFVLTFYQRSGNPWPGVKVEFIVENVWSSKMQDQIYELRLLGGTGAATQLFPPIATRAIKHPGGARWRKIFWDGAEPQAVAENFNLPYLVYSKAIPSYDTLLNVTPTDVQREMWASNGITGGNSTCTRVVSGTVGVGTQADPCCGPKSSCGDFGMDWITWYGSDKGDIGVGPANDLGQAQASLTPNGAAEGGMIQRQELRYLFTMGQAHGDFMKVALFGAMTCNDGRDANGLTPGNPLGSGGVIGCGGNVEANPHQPIHARESKSGLFYQNLSLQLDLGTQPATTHPFWNTSALGRPYSLDANPTARFVGNASGDNWGPTFTRVGPCTDGGWSLNANDLPPHHHDQVYVAYLLTGDYYLLEEMQFWASSLVLYLDTGVTIPYGRHLDWGSFRLRDRAQAWPFRWVIRAAAMTPDGMPEQDYYRRKLRATVEVNEGMHGITTGSFFNSCTTTNPYNVNQERSRWCWGNKTVMAELGIRNPLRLMMVQPLVNTADSAWLNLTFTGMSTQMWQSNFVIATMQHAEDLGLTEVTPLLDYYLPFFYHMAKDLSMNPYAVKAYMTPISRRMTLATALTSAENNTINLNEDVSSWFNPSPTVPQAVSLGSLEWALICGRGSPTALTICPSGRAVFGTGRGAQPAGSGIFPGFLQNWSDLRTGFGGSSGNAMTFVGGGLHENSYQVVFAAALAASAGKRLQAPELDGGGGTITALSAYDWYRGNLRTTDATTRASDLNANPKWAMIPRPKIESIRAIPGSTQVVLEYTAPTTDPCRYAVRSTPFPDTGDTGDLIDSQPGHQRSQVVGGLSPSAQHFYRISCGPSGGTSRETGVFSTTATGPAATLPLNLSLPPGLNAHHLLVSHGPTPALGSTTQPISCSGGCSILLNATRNTVLYYQLRYRDFFNTTLAISSIRAVMVP